MNKRIKIINSKQINQKIDRIACQIIEDNFKEKEIIVAGLVPGGKALGIRIEEAINRISPKLKILPASIRSDENTENNKFTLSIPTDKCCDKVIIIVDDILNTGNTLIHAIELFLKVPVKKIRTVVLVNRSHRLFPVHIDYAGLELSTMTHEYVKAFIDREETENAVYVE